MNQYNIHLDLHGRMDGVLLAQAFSRAVESVFGPDERTQPRFTQRRVRGERLNEAEGSPSIELLEAFFRKVPRYHYSDLSYSLPFAGDRSWAYVSVGVHCDPEDDGDAYLDFGEYGDWTEDAPLTSGRLLTPDEVIEISVRVIDAIRPDAAELFLKGGPTFPPSNFLRFHRDARFFAHDVRQVLRIAQAGDHEGGQDGFFAWMKDCAGKVGATQAYDELARAAMRPALTDKEWRGVFAKDGFDVRTVLAACRRTRFTETDAGVTLLAEKPLRSFVDEPYTALIRRAIGDPVAPKLGDDE